jgi:hypothetical protein
MSTSDSGTRVSPFTFAPPAGERETISFANANAYEWGYLDTCRELGTDPLRVPDGWAYAWLEYTRRHKSRMAIREAFRMWRDHHMLPNLDREES